MTNRSQINQTNDDEIVDLSHEQIYDRVVDLSEDQIYDLVVEPKLQKPEELKSTIKNVFKKFKQQKDQFNNLQKEYNNVLEEKISLNKKIEDLEEKIKNITASESK